VPANKTNFLEGKLVEHVLRNVSYTSPTTVYVGLFTVAPGEAGGGTEVSVGAYARQAVTFGAQSGGLCSNSGDILFPVATADWGTILAMAIFDALTTGNMLYYGLLGGAELPFLGADTGDLITCPGHTFVNGDKVHVMDDTVNALPAGLTAGTLYYVIGVSGDTLQLSTTLAGSAVAITADGTGWIALDKRKTISTDDQFKFAATQLQIAEL
jgi:hypothetical protein